jgi:hypothetical protein
MTEEEWRTAIKYEVAVERARCAKIAEDHKPPYPRKELSPLGRERFDACEAIAQSIRALSPEKETK